MDPDIRSAIDFYERHPISCEIILAKLKASRESGVPLPGLHSGLFAPVPESTLRTGVKAMTSAILELMKK